MDLRFITALVAFAGLFALAFVILGVLQRSSSQRSRQKRGRDDKGSDKQLAGKQGPPKRPSFHPCAAPGVLKISRRKICMASVFLASAFPMI